MSESRITIAGAGSIGCYVGGCLALGGRSVTLLLRPRLAAVIKERGLRVSDLEGGDRPVRPDMLRLAVDPGDGLPQADIILVTVKSGATAEIAELIAHHAPKDAVVVSLQNGVENAGTLRAGLDKSHRVIAGMVPFNVVQSLDEALPARFHRATSGAIHVASGVAGLRETLCVPGLPVAEHADMTGVLWGKLVLNLNNALNALSGLPLAAQLQDRRWRLILAAQVSEALAVLRASDIRLARIEGVHPATVPFVLRLPDVLFRLVARRMLAIDPTARSSMWEDLDKRRMTEIDHLQGAILVLAARAGVATPMTRQIARLIKQAEAAQAGSPRLTPADFPLRA